MLTINNTNMTGNNNTINQIQNIEVNADSNIIKINNFLTNIFTHPQMKILSVKKQCWDTTAIEKPGYIITVSVHLL